MKTDTAHEHWDEQWTTEEGRYDWIEPESFIVEGVELMLTYNIRSVLDLGCGPGRHALHLAAQGFEVHAMDASPTAVDLIRRAADERNLSVTASSGEMTDIDVATGILDMVLAWNVIYHGDLPVVQRSLSEVIRILRPGGLFVGTMLSKRNVEVRTGREVSHNTLVNDDVSDKDHPHYYCNATELISLFQGFEPLVLQDVEHKEPGSGSYHWQFIMEKK